MKSGAMAVLALLLSVFTALEAASAADVTRGEQLFHQCQICHAIGPQATNQVGPTLNGLSGRLWASVASFNYSAALLAGREAGKVWDDMTLQAWLVNPRMVAPGTKMLFAGLAQPDQRADLIAYIRQFDASGSIKQP